MSNIAVSLFLILFGIMHLIATSIPSWVLGFVALVAGLIVLAGGSWWRKG